MSIVNWAFQRAGPTGIAFGTHQIRSVMRVDSTHALVKGLRPGTASAVASYQSTNGAVPAVQVTVVQP